MVNQSVKSAKNTVTENNGNGYILKNWRKQAGYSRELTASLLGVTHQTIRYWERGKRNIDRKHYPRIAKLMGIHIETLEQLIGDSNNASNNDMAQPDED